jgi:RNA polymerase sigma-70 factor (ECF subfamily)
MESADRVRLVRQSLSTLAPRDRQLLQAVLMDEQDKDELCEQMGVTREYLRVLVHRAKQSFLAKYDKPSPARKSAAQR